MVAAVKAYALSVPITAFVVDTAAEKIALYAMGLTGIVVIWRNVARPLGAMIKAAVHIVKRTASAVDLLEHLPARWKENDERLAAVESEAAIALHEIRAVDDKVVAVANDVAAIRRELKIGDDKVRTPPTIP